MRWVMLLVVGLGALLASEARACAVCGCGDPTLTSMGNEKLFYGRTRGALGITSRTDNIGTPKVDRIRLFEVRSELSLVYAPTRWLALSASLPFLWREVSDVSLRVDQFMHVGDAEARGKLVLWQDAEHFPRHIVSTHAGIKFPTAPILRDAQGDVAAVELQPGTGSFDGLVGASYGFFANPWSAYVSATGFIPTRGLQGFQAGRSLRTTALVQYQFLTWLGARAGIDTRWDATATVNGSAEPDSGGFIAFASPELLWSPVMDLVVLAAVRIPVVNALIGDHVEGPMFNLGIVYDI